MASPQAEKNPFTGPVFMFDLDEITAWDFIYAGPSNYVPEDTAVVRT
jgi:hypothetical protein